VWLLERVGIGRDGEGLVGDLLEEMEAGRSGTWFWREVLTALAAGTVDRFGQVGIAAVFSAVWSVGYPVWAMWGPSRYAMEAMRSAEGMVWPLSSVVGLVEAFGPVMVYVWLGPMVFLLMRRELVRSVPVSAVVNGMSWSFGWLLVETIAMPKPVVCEGLGCVARPDFYSVVHVSTINVPIALSVLMAIVCMLAAVLRPPRRIRRVRVKDSGTAEAIWRTEITRPA
jgi:hypothetical protein